MKKFKIRALAVFSAVLIAAVSIPIASGGTFSVSAAGAELIPGGDMENTVFASNSEAQSGWRYNNGTSVSLSTEQKNSGNSSALLTTEASGYGALSYKPIKVEKNRDYVLSFAFFTETAAEKTPQWSLMSGTKYLSGAKNVKINGDAGKWQSVTALVNSGSYTELTLNIQIGSGGKYYVDDVSFKSEGDPYNLLKNGSFEKGLNSWNLSSDTAFGVSDISPIDGSSLSVAAGAGNTAESTFDCDKNSDYIFSFCSAAADNGTGDVRLEVTDMNGSVLAAGTAGESSEWLISRFAISSGNNDRLKVRIVSGNTAVLIDDIRIMRKAKINILPVEYGEIKGFSEIGYGEGETVSLTAEAEDGYIVSMWKSGDEKIASGESCTFTAFDMTLSVIIGKALVEIPNPGFEEDDLSAYKISFADGFTRSVDNPANGSYSLKISAGDTETRYKNATLTINVVPGLTYTVTFNGRRAESDKTAIFKVLDGENNNLLSGDYFINGKIGDYTKWGKNTVTFKSGDNNAVKLCFVMNNGDAYIDDLSVETAFTVSAASDEGGSVSGLGSPNQAYGKELTLYAVAEADYIFGGWYEGESKVSDTAAYTFKVTRSISLKAVFTFTEKHDNRIANGDCEQPINESWIFRSAEREAVINSTDSPFRGKGCMKIEAAGDRFTRYGYIAQYFTVEPNTDYAVSFYGKRTEKDKSAIFKILTPGLATVVEDRFVNGNGDKYNEWGINRAVFNSGENTRLMLLFVVNNGAAYVDNITVGKKCSLTLTVDDDGKETGKLIGAGYAAGEMIPLSETPKEGYKVSGWYLNGVLLSEDNPYDFVITRDTVLKVLLRESDDAMILNFETEQNIAPAGTNLIVGGDLETTDGAPWNTDTFLKNGVMQRVSGKAAGKNGYVLHFNPNSSALQTACFKVNLEPNTSYMLSFLVKGENMSNTNRGDMTFGITDADMNFLVLKTKRTGMYYDETPNSTTTRCLTPPSWDGNWHRRACVFTTGKYSEFYITVTGSVSNAWLDDIQLCRAVQAVSETTTNVFTAKVREVTTEKTYCQDKYNLVENGNIADLSGKYWNTGAYFGKIGSGISFETVENGTNALVCRKQFANPTHAYYIKWMNVQPNTDYTFSLKLRSDSENTVCGVIENSNGFYKRIIDWAAANEGEWNTLGATVNSGDNTVLGFYVTEASDFTEITDIRLFNPIYGEKPKEETDDNIWDDTDSEPEDDSNSDKKAQNRKVIKKIVRRSVKRSYTQPIIISACAGAAVIATGVLLIIMKKKKLWFFAAKGKAKKQ